ncbi:MAG: hypothetical protein ABIR91_03635, partial [Candidatus Saccharimonadales bacterium]
IFMPTKDDDFAIYDPISIVTLTVKNLAIRTAKAAYGEVGDRRIEGYIATLVFISKCGKTFAATSFISSPRRSAIVPPE